LPMRQSAPARSWRPRHSCYFTRRPPGLRGRATNRLLPPAEGLDRKPAIALTVINLGLLSSDAHGNSFTASAGKSLSPAAFDAPSRQRSVRSVKAFANCYSQVNEGYFFRADFMQPLERWRRFQNRV